MADKSRESRLVCRNVELFSVVEHAAAYSLSFLSGVFPIMKNVFVLIPFATFQSSPLRGFAKEIYGSEACYSKVPKLFVATSGAIIPLKSRQRRGSKPSNFAILFALFFVLFSFVSFFNFQNVLIDQLLKRSRLQLGNWLFGPETF